MSDHRVNEVESRTCLCVVTDRGSNMLAVVTDLNSEVCVALSILRTLD